MILGMLGVLLSGCQPAPPKDASGDTSVDTGGDTAPCADSGCDPVADLPLVPLPALVEVGSGSFRLGTDARFVVPGDADTTATAELLASRLRSSTGYALPVVTGAPSAGDVTLVLDTGAALPEEGYTLDVQSDGVTLTASDEAGLYYAGQTLSQLLPAEALAATVATGVDWVAPAVHIEDAPRFAWRGGMIDVARHFFDVATVERQVDLFALHKINRLHLHLTDDQGWRIEIHAWPNLTTIGGSTEVGGGEGGYYTQEDYAAIVAYAAERHVTVVPEIDLPGHANAAAASYPELAVDGVPIDLYTGTSVISTPIWVDGPATAGFVTDVWDEINAITPGGYAHLGGDEVIDLSTDDYAAFVQSVQSTLSASGKLTLGWDEVAEADLAPPFVAQYWYDAQNARTAITQGGRIIASPAAHCYFDMVYDGDATFGQVWAGPVDVQAAYDWDPVLSGMEETDVLGVEGALWTELVDDEGKVDFMLWPRMAALAEVGWSREDARTWDGFRGRLLGEGARLDALGVGWYRTPEIDWPAE